MVRRSKALRILVRLSVVALVLLLVLFTFVQVQQHLLRHQMELLLGDIQGIRLHKSDWSEAQRLMERWRAYGHAEGPCSSVDCVYGITVLDNWTRWTLRLPRTGFFSIETLNRISYRMRVYRILDLMGYRYGELGFRFLVHDNIIQQASTSLLLVAPAGPDNDYSVGTDWVLFSAHSSPSLREDITSLEDQLAAHPNYIITTLGGPRVDIIYSSDIPKDELIQATAFKLSCLTTFHPCKEREDVLPASRELRLHSLPPSGEKTALKRGQCDLPVWVLGRDTYHAWVVDVVSSKRREPWDETGAYETDEVRFVSSLIGSSQWKPGDRFTTSLRSWDWRVESLADAQHMNPGSRYIILPKELDSNTAPVEIRHCGVLKDDPAVVRALQDGFARQDAYRGPFLSYSSPH